MGQTANNESLQEERIEFKRLGFKLELLLSAEKTLCTASYIPSAKGAPISLEEFKTFLAQAKIQEGLSEPEITKLLAAAASGNSITNCIIAYSQDMIPGKNGRFELAVADSLQEESDNEKTSEETENSQIDLRHVQSFLNVSNGQLLGKVIEPEPGTPGKTLRGQTIPAQAGTPLVLNLLKNIRYGDDGISLYAEADGCLYLQGNDISIEENYIVKGDVDFKVGNILYNGFVEVKGDVLDGFTLNATKGIRIHGNIGVCEISSDGDIFFCGMNGQGKGSINCGGIIHANFIDDTLVEAKGGVLVETEIRNCFIHSNGSVKVDKGIIAGGECIALGGIESTTIGTASSQKTRLIAGVCHNDLLELNCLFNELKQLVANFSEPGKNRDMKEFARIRSDITARIQAVRSRQYPARNSKVNVKKRLHEGVTLTIGQTSDEIKEGRDGPFSIIENTLEGGFRYLGLTDLTVKAEDIEKLFVQQQMPIHRQNTAEDI